MDTAERTRRPWRRIDHLEQMIPYLFALGCARTWMTLTFAAPAGAPAALALDPHMVFDYVYAALGIAVTVFAVNGPGYGRFLHRGLLLLEPLQR